MEYPKNIRLLKLETLPDALYPQEDKYASGQVISQGLMWEWSKPEVGEGFQVHIGKLNPIFRTSTVVEIINDDKIGIEFKTLNSRYKIIYYEDIGN